MGTDIHGVFQKRTANGWEDVPSKYEQGRDYQLFAVLAGVRNGFGFAGVPTGEAVTPISEPRGLPSDFVACDDSHPIADVAVLTEWRRKYHEDGEGLFMGDHSHSWLTAAEILTWAETAPVVVKTGLLARDTYTKWDGKDEPASWCGGASGSGVVIVNDNQHEKDAQPDWTYVRCHWKSALRRRLAYFFDEVARLVGEHGEVRFVFGFDS